MNNPSPLVPQGSLLEQKNKSHSRVKLAFFCVVGVHVVGLMVLLMQGCKREQPPPAPEPELPLMTDTNLPFLDTIPGSIAAETNVPPPAPVPTPAYPELVQPPPVAQEYVIQPGDTLYDIGKKLNVPWKAIQDANPNINPNRLQPGQKIQIPTVTTSPAAGAVAPGEVMPAADGTQSYTVKSGDNLTKIAGKFGVTVRALRSANNLVTDRIIVGQKLIIPAKAAPSAPAPAPVESYPPPPVSPPSSTLPQ